MVPCSNIEMHHAAEAFLNSLFGAGVYAEWKKLKTLLKFESEQLFVTWILNITKEHIAQRLSQTSILEAKLRDSFNSSAVDFNGADDFNLHSFFPGGTFSFQPSSQHVIENDEPQNLVKAKQESNEEECEVKKVKLNASGRTVSEEFEKLFPPCPVEEDFEEGDAAAVGPDEIVFDYPGSDEESPLDDDVGVNEMLVDESGGVLENDDEDTGSGASPASSLVPQAYNSTSGFTCGECTSTFQTHEQLEKHKRAHERNSPYSCTICGTSFEQKVFLKIHLRTHQQEEAVVGSLSGEVSQQATDIKCDVCYRSFTHRLHLDRHVAMAHADKEGRKYSCSHCQKVFSREIQLLSHLKCHGFDKPFQCKFCPLTFSQGGALNAHLRVHTGERPYPCDFCGKRFSVKTNLLRHRRLHTGERPHVCALCQRGFSRIDTYRAHMQSYHGQSQAEVSGSEKPATATTTNNNNNIEASAGDSFLQKQQQLSKVN